MKTLLFTSMFFISFSTFAQQDSTRTQNKLLQPSDSLINCLTKDLQVSKSKVVTAFSILAQSENEMDEVANKRELTVQEREKQLMQKVIKRHSLLREILTEDQFRKLKAFMVRS
jgi:hypothetical protein